MASRSFIVIYHTTEGTQAQLTIQAKDELAALQKVIEHNHDIAETSGFFVSRAVAYRQWTKAAKQAPVAVPIPAKAKAHISAQLKALYKKVEKKTGCKYGKDAIQAGAGPGPGIRRKRGTPGDANFGA